MEEKVSLIKFIGAIELLSKSKSLRSGDVEQSVKEILKLATESLDCERANAWIFNDDMSVLESLMSYVKTGDTYNIEPELHRVDLPKYFNELTKNEILISNDAVKEDLNSELVDIYLNPNKIKSMIDIPIRSEGEMIGVVCFEQVNTFRKWTHEERRFAQSLAQLISFSLETNKKKNYRLKLESLIRQKDALISEINHRVKNNISVIIGLINLQQHKSKNSYHTNLFQEIKDKVFSMSAVHEQLLLSKEIDKINISDFLSTLLNNLSRSYEKSVEVIIEKENIFIDITKGIPLGLIANEIITNSYKHAFGKNNIYPKLNIKCLKVKNEVSIVFQDNGPGYNWDKENVGMGIGIIKDLCNQIDGQIDFINREGAYTVLKFNVN
ncbi:MAG: hypothetical protein CL844_00780 [Crocinitomicaceae bacterium]|nr:hypothetical protein [Crocinitomicaceae bacterium]|tara:strand:- start:21496 stop:22641 length:1146 start_codon:yes stop_codon:yes gene_type:complete